MILQALAPALAASLPAPLHAPFSLPAQAHVPPHLHMSHPALALGLPPVLTDVTTLADWLATLSLPLSLLCPL